MPTAIKKKLTKKEMIVAVAKDVIKLTKIKAPLNVRTGIYLGAGEHNYKQFSKKELQNNIPNIAKDCTVCALGALVLAKIHCFNGATELPIGFVKKKAIELVGEDQASLIEDAFESGRDFYFGDKIHTLPTDATERLQAIMRNIIKNKGTFRPEQFASK